MTTQLERPIRREIWIDQKPYTLTITAEGFTLVEKRRRKGTDLRWRDLIASRDGVPARSSATQAQPVMSGNQASMGQSATATSSGGSPPASA